MRTTALHGRLRHLAHGQRPWKHGTTCQICAGTAHDVARLDPLCALDDPAGRDADPTIAPGREGLVRIRLQAPIPTWRGQRIILRGFDDPAAKGTTAAVNYGRTLGGGVVIDPQPSSGRSQRKRWIALGQALQEPEASARLEALVLDAAALGIGIDEIERRADVASPDRELDKLAGKNGPIVPLGGNRYVHRDRVRKLVDVAIATVDRFHAEQAMQPGLNRAALESMLPPPVAPDVASRAVDMAIERGALRAVDDKGTVARPGKGLEAGGGLPPDVQRILDAYVAAGITAPTVKDLAAQCGLSHRQVLDIVGILQRVGRIVRITADISLAKESHDDLIERIRAHMKEHGTIDVQALKQMTGLSRKYAVPFLEHVDQLMITRRQGDLRVPGPRA
jgi:selenocysteine-specific elongation factor